jgi:cobalt-zinc-cadmium efflux system protein
MVGSHDHDGHRHSSVARPTRQAQRRALWVTLVVNACYLVVEVVGGFAFGSLALLADAAHMATDVGALVIALVAHVAMERPATDRHSYGLKRAEVLAAQLNGVVLIGVSVLIVVEAIHRLGQHADVRGGGVVVVASIGLAVNLASALVLKRVRGDSLNLRAAFLHMAADAAGSVAAIVAGLAVLVWNATWVDSVASILIAVLVAVGAIGLLRDTTNVLLEGAPRGIDPDAVRAALGADRWVEAVHHVHLWSLASDEPALSAHVVLEGEVTLHEAQERGRELKDMLADRFGIDHATLELECHACDEVVASPSGAAIPDDAGARPGAG